MGLLDGFWVKTLIFKLNEVKHFHIKFFARVQCFVRFFPELFIHSLVSTKKTRMLIQWRKFPSINISS